MSTPENAPDQSDRPAPPPAGGSQPTGWGEPPRYGQYAPGYDSTNPPAAQQPQYGSAPQNAPASGQYGQNQYGQFTPFTLGMPGGKPPADKPGIVPLRPLTLGELYDGAFGAVRHNPAVTLGLTAIIVGAAVIVGTLVSIPLTNWFTDLFSGIFSDAGIDPAADGLGITQDMLGVTYGSTIGTGLLVSLVTPLAMGIIAISISDSVIGRKISVSEAWRRAGRRAWFLLGYSILNSLLTTVVTMLAIGVIIALFVVDPMIGGLSLIVLIPGFIMVGLWLLTRLALIAPALAVEGGRFWATCARGWKLTRGSFWRVLGIYLLTMLMMWIISNILLVPIQFVMGILLAAANDVGVAISSGLSSAITGGLSALFVGGVIALLYIDTRMRREGLDVQLQVAAAEADK